MEGTLSPDAKYEAIRAEIAKLATRDDLRDDEKLVMYADLKLQECDVFDQEGFIDTTEMREAIRNLSARAVDEALERVEPLGPDRPLCDFETGARVRKPSAIPLFDFAFGRTGTVCRDAVDGRTCVGVMWDGANRIYEYPDDYRFQEAHE